MTPEAMMTFTMIEGDFKAVGAASMFAFLSIVILAVFTFISIAVWAGARRKEREAFYKSESQRRVAEASGDAGKYLIEMMREEERIRRERELAEESKRRYGLQVGGLVTLGVGVGLAVFLASLGGRDSPWLVGAIPGSLGVALLASAYLFTPKPPSS